MAQEMLQASKMKLVFDYGVDEDNQPIHKTKTFNRIRLNASADQLYQAATAIGSLSTQPLWNIERNDTYQIGE
ncbi:hypothetical protein J2Z23_003093 [Lederbergia galactosidilyticus]|uniref:DUF1659 domain-containing protein n=1 Tax=Lederbergia galactosidilytica TaxID=217031 RepID=UPI001AEAB0A4|nr:DUF1659 domain-containing protein [Lederbergia galactosidilytica]MBP1916111.1 hypothetical protein [Lederbergia galactosidilytica]